MWWLPKAIRSGGFPSCTCCCNSEGLDNCIPTLLLLMARCRVPIWKIWRALRRKKLSRKRKAWKGATKKFVWDEIREIFNRSWPWPQGTDSNSPDDELQVPEGISPSEMAAKMRHHVYYIFMYYQISHYHILDSMIFHSILIYHTSFSHMNQ